MSAVLTGYERRSATTGADRPLAEVLAFTSAGVAAVACALVVFRPHLLNGPAAMNGSARGTALVALVVAVPLLLGSVTLAARGNVRAVATWLGSLAFLVYNGFLLVFATPFNDLFLPCLLMLSSAVWALIAALAELDVVGWSRLFAPATPVRPVATYIAVVAGANAVLWLTPVLRATFESGPPKFLDETGLTTNPVYVQDLAFWLPLMGLAAGWLARRRPWGFVLAASGLVLWVIEAVSIAVDQWLGHAADPTSPVASASLTPAFLALAAVGLVPLAALLRGLPAGSGLPGRTWSVDGSARRGLVAVEVAVAGLAVVGGLRMMRDGFGMPTRWLAGTGFHSWLLPGLALLVGVALPQAVAAALVLRRRAHSVVVAGLTGVGLVLWIVVQLAVLQRGFFLQPVIAVVGALEVVLTARATSTPRHATSVRVTVVRAGRP